MQKEFLAARRAGVPAIQITTPDPASTMRKIVSWLPKGSPVFNWNPVNGLLPHEKNPHAIQFMEVIVGENQESTISPVEALRLARKLPSGVNADPNLRAVLFMQGLNSMLTDAQVIQAIWNLRDPYKSNGRMLILVGPEADLPAELASDFLGLTDPLPDKTELEGIIRAIYEPYNMTPPADVLEKAVDATLGLPAFPAEQCIAMSIGKNGVLDTDLLWKRKEQEVSKDGALMVEHPQIRFSDIVDCDNAINYVKRYVAGDEKPALVILLDEVEKQIAGIGRDGVQGDSSGTSMDQMGVILSEMNDNKYRGIIAIGPSGSGKTLFSRAIGCEAGSIFAKLDLGKAKNMYVGSSEQKIRQVFQKIKAIGRGRVLFVATCNSIGILPPEFRRRFSLGTFFFDVLSKDGRDIAWKIYRKRYDIPESFALPKDTDWTGEEIDRCCDISRLMKMDLVEAASYIIPVARSMGKKLEEMRVDCSGKFISARYPGPYIYEPPKQDAGRFMDMNDN